MFSIFSNKPLSELSLQELKSQEQSTQTFIRWLVVFFVLMVIVVFIWAYTKGYHTTNIIFLVVFALFNAMIGDKLKKIRAEISSRA